jgi:ABC-type branched-subunit amino acid transport system ATPase component
MVDGVERLGPSQGGRPLRRGGAAGRQRLLEAVRAAADERGAAVLLVEQHVRKALRYADRAYVMRRGRIELSGTAAELRSRITEIEDHYLSSTTEPV